MQQIVDIGSNEVFLGSTGNFQTGSLITGKFGEVGEGLSDKIDTYTYTRNKKMELWVGVQLLEDNFKAMEDDLQSGFSFGDLGISKGGGGIISDNPAGFSHGG